MAYIEKRRTGKGEVRYRVQIRRKGQPDLNRTFRTAARAKAWALQVEAGVEYPRVKHTLADAMRDYALEVSPTKRGGRWERVRLAALGKLEIAGLPIATIDSDRIGKWRNARLLEVGPATVRRELNLLQSVFEVARREWKWIRTNPVKDVRKPQEPPARRRGVKDTELAALAAKAQDAGYREVLAGFELGIETGMRAGEMWSLEREQIDLNAGVARLERTKNGDARDVALSPRAIEIIRGLLADERPMLFTITNAVRDGLFRKLRTLAGIPDLHFHDSRSEAVSRLSRRLPIMELAAQIGHRDLNSLNSYYQPSAADRAKRLRASAHTRPQPRPRPSGGVRRQGK